jgi:hypothetical protein
LLREKLNVINLNYPDHKIYMFLDAIDQLNFKDFNLGWIFKHLPPNTKIVYSVINNYENLLTNLELKIKNDRNFLEIKKLEMDSSLQKIESQLIRDDIDLTQKQKRILKRLLKKADNINIFYLNLLYDILSRLNSFDEEDSSLMNEFSKCITINKCIEYLFNLFESIHGKLFIQNCLFYINEFNQNGINEKELVDIMTLDDDLLQSIFRIYLPNTIQFPIFIWKQFQNDINTYLTYNQETFKWNHIQFYKVIKSKYKIDDSVRDKNLFNIFHFFKQTYNDLNHEKKSIFVVNQTTSYIESFRSTMNQQMIVIHKNKKLFKSNILYDINKRKLVELPRLILKFKTNIDFQVDELKKSVFFNFAFIYSVILLKDLRYISDLKQEIINLYRSLAYSNQIESILIFLIVFEKSFDILTENPINFMYYLRSRLIEYCLYSKDEHFYSLFDYSAALKLNKMLLEENCPELKVNTIIPLDTIYESNLSFIEEYLFKDRFWIKFWSNTPILFRFNKKEKQIEIYNYESETILEEISVKFIEDSLIKKEILFIKDPLISDTYVNEYSLDAYIFSQLDDILIVHNLHKIQKQYLDIFAYKQYFVFPSHYILIVFKKQISLFNLLNTNEVIQEIDFDSEIINCDSNLNYNNILIPSSLDRAELSFVFLFKNELKVFKFSLCSMCLLINIPLELEITSYFYIKFDQNFILNNSLPKTKQNMSTILSFLIGKVDNNIQIETTRNFNDELYFYEIQAIDIKSSNLSLNNTDGYEHKFKQFRFEYKDVFALYEKYIYALDNLNNLLIFNIGKFIFF